MAADGPSSQARPLSITPITHADVSELTYDRVRELITRGDLPPATKVDLDYLAKSLHVSRTTVANALQRLALEELVFIVPRRGTFVQRFGARDLCEMYDIRLCLELWAARQCIHRVTDAEVACLRQQLEGFLPLFDGALRKDLDSFASQNYEFHTCLVRLAQNSKLLSVYQGLNIDVVGARMYRLPDAVRSASTVYSEHEAVVLGYEARDLSRIEAAITTHLTTARDSHRQAFGRLNMGA